MIGTFLVGVELDAGIVRAGAQGGIQIKGELDLADPPQGLDALGKPILQSGRIYMYKFFPKVRLSGAGDTEARCIVHGWLCILGLGQSAPGCCCFITVMGICSTCSFSRTASSLSSTRG
jgi:hypothetical protein